MGGMELHILAAPRRSTGLRVRRGVPACQALAQLSERGDFLPEIVNIIASEVTLLCMMWRQELVV